jgi:hypothetical protein
MNGDDVLGLVSFVGLAVGGSLYIVIQCKDWLRNVL